MQETRGTQIWSLGQEDPLEEGMATHSGIPAWRIPETEEPGGLQSMGSQRVGHDWSDLAHTHAGRERGKKERRQEGYTWGYTNSWVVIINWFTE